MYLRALKEKLLNLIKKFPILAVLGPRQSGKTTLVKETFPNYAYANLENINQRELAISDPPYFLKSYEKNGGLIIDEAQHAPGLFSYLQLEVDKKKDMGRYVLTGSQNFLLNEHVSQTLAGRVAIFDLLPLSIGELSLSSLLSGDLNENIFKGGYPAIYARNLDPPDWSMNYIRTYLERDVRQMKNVNDLSTFQRFLKLCAGRIGQVINFSELGRDCGISYQTVKAWISLLEASFIIFMLPPYYRNFSRRVVKSKKLYFIDTGLACNLLQIENSKQLINHYLRGGLFESYVISDLIKQRCNRGKQPNCFFWRDDKGHEVDCILELGGEINPIEIKATETIRKEFFKNLTYFSEISGANPRNTYLIYGGKENQIRREGKVVGWPSINELYRS
ncbi:MAG: ATP-binding protein [Waddliaceae bacterium]